MILYKYYSDISYALKSLMNGTIYLNDLKYMNDPSEQNIAVNGCMGPGSLITTGYNWNKICCFTTNPLDYLMWSHYGNKHKGICIGYSFEIDSLKKGDIVEISDDPKVYLGRVVYNDKPLLFKERFPEFNSKEACKLFIRKYEIWKYEKEYRVFHFRKDPTNLEIPTIKISEVYYGIQINNNDKGVFHYLCLQKGITDYCVYTIKKSVLSKCSEIIDLHN